MGATAKTAGVSNPVFSTESAQTQRYNEAAHFTSRAIIYRYSTSFGMATRLLSQPVRSQVEDIYALVRLADEIVDGVAVEAGCDEATVRECLDELEQQTERAMQTGFSSNLIVHAFARTARTVGIGTDLTRPFFASMRADITETVHTPESFAEYVYGSAEVVGLMCLEAFLADGEFTQAERANFVAGARALGAAFQKVNFLRDLAADLHGLGRAYFPDVDVTQLTEQGKRALVANIDADLAVSARTVALLPKSSRRAVYLAQLLFAELNRQIARTPVEVITTRRIRVSGFNKFRLLIKAMRGKVRFE